MLHVLSPLIKNNEKTFIEYLAGCLIAIYNAKRSIEDEMVTVDDIYRQTAIDILRETTIFSIQNSKKVNNQSEGLNFRNMYYFYENEYHNRMDKRSNSENVSVRTIRNPRKLSLKVKSSAKMFSMPLSEKVTPSASRKFIPKSIAL